ncbi:hypothetical protein SAMN05444000_12816 [Shimia gijangensis]|uniref:DUF2059 domain-containing protein n=1 Tax=Shimia gijangensis TaxID=1470563 RepID=A0A1M6S861_9RHOB|nr:DUF2059 domain-containing protein [Shimia gijangensis]SHK40994.1 hypothetical protein SAMN05444000_12816 [Shimia gijangensis]
MVKGLQKIRVVLAAVLLAVMSVVVLAPQTRAADRSAVEAFLKVTGFDVAIDSIALSAESAPEMLGLDAGDFGAEWRFVSKQVFDPEVMQERATKILVETLEDSYLAHAAEFYASDLGLRLVEAENVSHFEDDTVKYDTGREIVAEMVKDGSERIELLRRMNHAIDPNDIGPQAVQEIQIRFILAASYAGVIDLKIDEDGLRAALAENENAMRLEMEASSLANSAYTYREFSDAEVLAYTEALEHPDMQVVYELMNAVHFEVMMNRFQLLATKMGNMQPQQDL